jgi:hypothetical protein
LETFVTYLPAIACGAMMLLICIPMKRNMHKDRGESAGPASRQEIAELREEVARVKAERALEDASETVDG